MAIREKRVMTHLEYTGRYAAAAAFAAFLLSPAPAGEITGQTAQAQIKKVMLTSDPPGASIWTKQGRDYKCSDSVTPTPFELTFYGSHDVKQILLTRFGYSNVRLKVAAADEKIGAKLEPVTVAPTLGNAAAPEVQSMRAGFAEEFVRALTVRGEALRCLPLEILVVGVSQDESTHQMEMLVTTSLSGSGSWRNLQLASRRTTDPESGRNIARAALEGGVADVLAAFGSVLTQFPEVPKLTVSCMYMAAVPVLGTEQTRGMHYVYEYRYDPGTRTMQPYAKPVFDTIERDVFNDEVKPQTVFLRIPVAKIPVGGDRKSVTEAFLVNGEIKRMP